MNKIVWNDAWTGPDKTKHALYCAGGAFAVGLVAGIPQAVVAGAAVAAGKEVVYDAYMGKGTPSPQDFVASMVGVVLGAFTAFVIRSATGA